MNELKVIQAICALERPTLDSIAQHAGCGRATVDRVIKRLTAPIPEGFGMEIHSEGHRGSQRWTIDGWGVFDPVKFGK